MPRSLAAILAHYERRFPAQEKLRFDRKDESLIEQIVRKTDLCAPDQSYLTDSETWKTKEQATKEVMHGYASFYAKGYALDITQTAQDIMGASVDTPDLPQHIRHITKLLTALRRLRVMERLDQLASNLKKGDLKAASNIYTLLADIDPPAADLALDLLRDYRRTNAPPPAGSSSNKPY